jgi:TRAP-type C4-dicarboxylate transport system permease large subunit
MSMPTELLTILVMLAVFAAGVFWLKLPSGLALALAAVAGALAGGEGIPLRHLIEGTFGYLDAVVIIATAMVFMKAIEASGALGTLSYAMVSALSHRPTLLMILVALFVMFPGMLTGLSSSCILTTGALVTPALLAMRIPAVAVGSFLALTAVFGMIAPPINIPVMIIGGGVDMPYIGFEGPLLLASVPVAILTAVYVRVRYVRRVDREAVLGRMPTPVYSRYGIWLFLPIVVVIGLLAAIRLLPAYVPDIGVPLVFAIGTVVAIPTGERFSLPRLAREAIRDALPVMGILVGVGMFVQIMALTGARGYLAVAALELPRALLYVGISLIMPAFGSAYAASSVLGIPLVYVFLGTDEVVVASGLSLIAGLADMMPPPLLLCVFAGQLVGVSQPFRILKASIVPMIAAVVVGVLMIVFAAEIGSYF